MIHIHDTIVSIATAPGKGAVGMVRISGSDAIATTNKIFKGKNLEKVATHTLHFGCIINTKKEEIDEVLVSVFRAPKSYTGENVCEITGHGSPFILNEIVHCCIEAGARMALPGEFTQRAFLHVKMDVAQAEAVSDFINAETKAAQETALQQMRGGFSDELNDLRQELIDFTALLELELDFSEKDVEFADREALHKLLDKILSKTKNLIDSFKLGNVIKN